MKLSPLLSRFLIENKKLSLPGIGTFHAEVDPIADPDSKKGNPAIKIRYQNEKITSFSPELVNFIAKETGKMKVLADSDLTSQLDDVIQYLNTGKIYQLQGIGSLITKPDNSGYYFEPETSVTATKKKEPVVVEKTTIPPAFIDDKPSPSKNKKSLIILSLLTVLAVIATIWFYYKNYSDDAATVPDETATATETNKVVPEAAAKTEPASTVPIRPAGSTGSYKFILETTEQPRASKRLAQLKSFGWDVALETSDSVHYNIVTSLPASGLDTTKAKDSLSRLYGKKVQIAP